MSLNKDLNNPELFTENQAGDYTYEETEYGKTASGQLTLDAEIDRDSEAQRSAGGDDRRGKDSEYGVDDGGHLIGARYGASGGEENLTAQDRNLNRGDYKRMENDWAEHLESGDKVYVHMESYSGDGSERPTNYMGYAIFEHPDGTRDYETYDFNNESRSEQESWEAEVDQYYEDNPEAVEEEMASNTAMPYQYDEETDTLTENPYYIPEPEESQSESAPDYGAASEVSAGESTGTGQESGTDNSQGM